MLEFLHHVAPFIITVITTSTLVAIIVAGLEWKIGEMTPLVHLTSKQAWKKILASCAIRGRFGIFAVPRNLIRFSWWGRFILTLIPLARTRVAVHIPSEVRGSFTRVF